jgi:hypothetical protein
LTFFGILWDSLGFFGIFGDFWGILWGFFGILLYALYYSMYDILHMAFLCNI